MATAATHLNFADTETVAVDDEATAVKFRYFPVLDGLRGLAILVVMIYHLEFLVPDVHEFVKGGFLGVDIFFVLSGFLITSILLKEYEEFGQINLKNFYIRRLFRLAPAFWVFLLCLYLFGYVLLPRGEADLIYANDNFAYAFFYLMNWHRALGDAVTGNLNHTWSLAIEEQFYILWSLVLFKAFAENKTRKQIALFTGLFVLVLIAWRAGRALIGMDIDVLYYSTDTRIDALLIGCVAAMIYFWRLVPDKFFVSMAFNLIAIGSCIIAAFTLLSFEHKDMSLYYGPLSVFSVAVAVMILWLVNRKHSWLSDLLGFKLLRLVGQISYALYLWHYLFYEFAKKSFSSVPLQITVGVGSAFAVSAASYFLVEKPFLRLKGKFSR